MFVSCFGFPFCSIDLSVSCWRTLIADSISFLVTVCSNFLFLHFSFLLCYIFPGIDLFRPGSRLLACSFSSYSLIIVCISLMLLFLFSHLWFYLGPFSSFYLFSFLKILFMYSWETQRCIGIGTGKMRLHARSLMCDLIPQDPGIMTWAKAHAQPLRHPGALLIQFLC